MKTSEININITAKNTAVFAKAERILNVMEPRFVNMFSNMDTMSLGNDIIKLETSPHHYDKDGYMIPEGATNIRIFENDKSVIVVASFDIYKVKDEVKPGNNVVNRFTVSLTYNTPEKKIQFRTEKMFDPAKVMEAILYKDSV